MANSMKGGEIYFVIEQDPRTGALTDYCKIGIVRDSENRSSESRVKEHQTGNPRQLQAWAVLKSDIVEAVETTLHGLYAPWRLSGEWFFLSQDQREKALATARRLAEEAAASAPDMKTAIDLKNLPSTGEVVPATEEAREAFDRSAVLRKRLTAIGALSKRAQAALRPSIEADGGTNRFGTIQVRKGAEQFDEMAFKAAHEDLWATYMVQEEKLSGPFRLATAKPDVAFDDVTALEQMLADAESRAGEERFHAIHALYLQCLVEEAVCDWELAALEARVKVLCGTAPGIEGVCTWNRVFSEKTSLDKVSLKADHPELYGAYASMKEDSHVLVVAKDNGFQHQDSLPGGKPVFKP